MTSVIYKEVIDYFKREKTNIINEWVKIIVTSPTDPSKDLIEENGEQMYNLIFNILEHDVQNVEDYIKALAIPIAYQRVKANTNIGDFVYNVNLGKKLIFKYLQQFDHNPELIQDIVFQINDYFDQFLFYTVTHYSDQKNKIIEEKEQFIDSTHKDRLTLLGQMTSSFIHEFRNPLTSVQGFIKLLRCDFPDMPYLDIVSNELEQLNFRISQFLLLSKKELIGKEKEMIFLDELIEEVLLLLYPSILDCKVKIIKDVDHDIRIYGYEDEVRQVITNIIFNAIDVLAQYRTDPLIEIKSNLQDNGYVLLDIANNGPEIPIDLQSSIFEPFVTTKTLGTGIGLFVCKEIIEKHKGKLICISEYDRTVFRISLPILTEVIHIN